LQNKILDFVGKNHFKTNQLPDQGLP